MDVDVTVDVGPVVDMLERVLHKVDDLSGFWDDLDGWWNARQSDWFASGRIARNDPATVRLKGSATPLVDSGNLRDATLRNQPFNAGPSDATFGLRKGTPEYTLGILNLSGPRGAPKRRAVRQLTAAEKREVVELLEKHLMRGAQ